MKLQIPRELYSETSTLQEQLKQWGAQSDSGATAAREVLALLPDDLADAPAFFDVLTKMWRYEFGSAYDRIGGSSVMYGTDQCPPVDRLARVLTCAYRLLDSTQLRSFLGLLGQRSRHDEALAEFAPVLRLSEGVPAMYEVGDHSPDAKSIDWFIKPRTGRPVLLEVKCRKRDLLDHLAQIVANPGVDPAELLPQAQSERLFDDVEGKFLAGSSEEVLQGAWIHSPIMQHQDSLNCAFNALDPSRVHFAVLANWTAEALVLSREHDDRNYILELFDLSHSDRFIIDEGAAG